MIFVAGDFLGQLDEVFRLLATFRRIGLQALHHFAFDQVVRTIENLRNMVELQGVVVARFADVEVAGDRRQFDVGQHAAILSAVSVRTIELLDGDFQRAERPSVGDVEQVLADVLQALHRPLAVCRRVADDQPTVIILNGRRRRSRWRWR